MDLSEPVLAAIGAITAAIIAGAVSFVGTVLAKDMKTSEFRQAWIDGLRNDVAELISIVTVITDIARTELRRGKKLDDVLPFFLEKHTEFMKAEMVHARIKLRLNPDEHMKLLDSMENVIKFPASGKILDSKYAETVVANLVKESQNILKSEWRRVKRGEPAFIITKFSSLLIMILAIILAILYFDNRIAIQFRLH